MKVLLVGDVDSGASNLAESLTRLAESEFAVEKIGVLSDKNGGLKPGSVNVVLLDVVGEGGEIAALAEVQAKVPDVPVIILSNSDDKSRALDAMKCGAQDFLVKEQLSGELLVRSIRYAVERKRTEAFASSALAVEHQVIREIVEHAPIGIFTLDDRMQVTEVNGTVTVQLGMDRDQIVGRSLFDVLPGFPRKPLTDAVEQGLSFRTEAYAIRSSEEPQSRPTYWDIAIWPLKSRDGQCRGAVLTTLDVSGKMRLVQQREDLMDTLTHDLKAPILGTDRVLTLLLDGVLGKLEPGQVQILQMLKQSNDNLLKMAKNLLAVYRYEGDWHELTFEPCDVAILVQACVRELSHQAETRSVHVMVDCQADLPQIWAHRAGLRSVLINLLDNAIKFTSEGGDVSVIVREQGARMLLQVRDTGKGIPPEDRPKLFQRFWQGEPGKKHAGGTGIGLYLCRQIVEVHNGKITFESEVDRGTTFTVTLPFVSR